MRIVPQWTAADIRRLLWVVGLLVALAVCAGLLLSSQVTGFWKVVTQVTSVFLGGLLGNAVKADQSRSLIRQQAGSAIRRLIEQATRMGDEVNHLESRRDEVRDNTTRFNQARVADWLDDAARALRAEIEATTSAIDDWGGMAPDVKAFEIKQFEERAHRQVSPREEGEV